MDIDKALTNFTNKEDLVTFIRDLPQDSTGVLCFRCPSPNLSEDGEELELLKYKSYGELTVGDAVLLGLEIVDFARGI